jgi:hypothetical protein
VAQHLPLGGQLHLSAALPPPANLISMRLREAPTAVRDSSCVGSSLPSGTPAVAASTAVFPVLDKDCTNEKKSTVADSYSVGSPLPPAILLDRSHLTLSAAWAETSFTRKTNANHLPLGGELHVSAALPPPANIPIKLREAHTACRTFTVSAAWLPSGTPAALRPAMTVRAAKILIENARLEFRVNHRKQTLAIMSNRERMALPSLHKSARGETDLRTCKARLISNEVSYSAERSQNELRPNGLVPHRIQRTAK